MWDHRKALEADLTFALRRMLGGHASLEPVARACGLAVADLRTMLATPPRTRLQPAERIR